MGGLPMLNERRSPPSVGAERLALTIKEAADAIGVSERTLRDLLPEIPHTHLGRRVVIPVESFRQWLHSRARAEEMGSKRAAEDILAALNGDSK